MLKKNKRIFTSNAFQKSWYLAFFHCSSKASLLHLFTVIVHKDSLAWLLTQLKADATEPFLFLNGSLTLKSEWLCDGFPLRAQSIQSMIC